MGGGDVESPDPLTATGEFQAEEEAELPDPLASEQPQAGTSAETQQQTETVMLPAAETEAQQQMQGQAQAESEIQPREQTAEQPEARTEDAFTKPPASDSDDQETEIPLSGDLLSAQAERQASDIVEVDARDLAIRSRKIIDEEQRIIVDSPDTPEPEAEARVTSAESLLTLEFEANSTTIGPKASEGVAQFIVANVQALEGVQISIWSFTDYTATSVSTARRVAYYRALAARNELLSNGLDPENVEVEIRAAPSDAETDTVKIIARP